MSWNATVDRLRARAQHGALAGDAVTRTLLYEAVDEIERMAKRVPDPDDLSSAAAACEHLAAESRKMNGPSEWGATAAEAWLGRAARLRRAIDEATQ